MRRDKGNSRAQLNAARRRAQRARRPRTGDAATLPGLSPVQQQASAADHQPIAQTPAAQRQSRLAAIARRVSRRRTGS
jgi:hypothetical protein